MVGLEPTASWPPAKRAAKLRHIPKLGSHVYYDPVDLFYHL